MEQQLLQLIISNTQSLQPGVKSSYTFTTDGGSIGAQAGADWLLKSSANSAGKAVKALHCEVIFQDHHFCIRDLCGDTYVNGATTPLGLGNLARLENKDTITVGGYTLRVSTEAGEEQFANQTLDNLFNEQAHLLADFDGETDTKSKVQTQQVDPVTLLGSDKPLTHDLLGDSFEGEGKDSVSDSGWLLEDEASPIEEKETAQADSEFEVSSAIKLKKRSRFNPFAMFSKAKDTTEQGHTDAPSATTVAQASAEQQPLPDNLEKEVNKMDDKELDQIEQELAIDPYLERADEQQENHILSGPLFKGLGVAVAKSNHAEDVHMVSEEVGAALQAAIKGLLNLHAHVDSGRYEVINKNLQPIEDNPLRLGLSYDETVTTLFDNAKGNVHLSAPSAISESLNNLKDHNDVVQVATTLALGQIVQAFSPQTLMKRFERYRRSYEVPEQNKGAWAWEMYENYYQELTSDRQQGFEKLFWEVFEQAYDRLLREKQQESK